MRQWREELLDTTPVVCVERALITTRTYREHEAEPAMLKRAYTLRRVLGEMTIFIEPQSRLAGNQSSANRAAPIMPEYAMDWVIDELDEFDRRPGDRFTITEQAKQALRDIAPYWAGRTLADRALALMPPTSRQFYDLGIIHPEGNITAGDAHLAVNYRRLLREGLGSLRRRTEAATAALYLTDPEHLRRWYFYRAVLVVLDAVADYAERYARLAGELAAAERDPGRAAELRELSRVLTVVPERPATTFHEAVQSVWLLQVALQIESNGHSLSYGRLDQYLWPYLERDPPPGAPPRTRRWNC
jgi:formate C-acetyltransferase